MTYLILAGLGIFTAWFTVNNAMRFHDTIESRVDYMITDVVYDAAIFLAIVIFFSPQLAHVFSFSYMCKYAYLAGIDFHKMFSKKVEHGD